MKLITKKIKEQLAKYPLYSQDGKGREAIAVAKFFLPAGAWTWYVMESDEDGDTLDGICINGQGEGEYGYFSLKEMQELRVTRLGLTMERDIYFEPTILCKIQDEYLQAFLDKMYE